MNDRLEQDMHDVIDGTAVEEQSLRVRSALAQDEEARRRYREMEELHERLARAPRYPAPAEIRPAVLRAIHASVGPPPTTFWSEFRESISRRPAVGMAWAFVTGAMLVLAVLSLLRGPSLLPGSSLDGEGAERVAGTMVRNGEASGFREVSQGRLELPGGTALARVLQSRNVLRVELSADIAGETNLILSYPDTKRVLTRIIPDGPANIRVDMAPGRVAWHSPTAGAIALEFSVDGVEDPFALESLVDGVARRISLATQGGMEGR
ncbi:MAG TPA: hypothetical protein VF720_06545 [Candidatus Eisenbacteria bacterium]